MSECSIFWCEEKKDVVLALKELLLRDRVFSKMLTFRLLPSSFRDCLKTSSEI